MLTTIWYWVVGIAFAIGIVAVALVIKYLLVGIGIILIIGLIAGLIVTGLKESAQNNKPPE